MDNVQQKVYTPGLHWVTPIYDVEVVEVGPFYWEHSEWDFEPSISTYTKDGYKVFDVDLLVSYGLKREYLLYLAQHKEYREFLSERHLEPLVERLVRGAIICAINEQNFRELFLTDVENKIPEYVDNLLSAENLPPFLYIEATINNITFNKPNKVKVNKTKI
jgi:uncharacterized protein YjhX (UPF0386 family)